MDIDLINAALIAVLQSSMADPSKPRGRIEAAAVQRHLDVRREVLEAHAWTGCDCTTKLEPEADAIVPPGFSYVAVLPANFIGLWAASADKYALTIVGEGESARRRLAWCGDASITIRYSGDVPYALMNPLLKKACKDALAAELAPHVSDKQSDRKIHNDIAVQSQIQCAARDAFNRKEGPLFGNGFDTANAGFGDDPYYNRRGTW